MYSVILKKQCLSGFIIHTSNSITVFLHPAMLLYLRLVQGLYFVPLTSKI